MPKERVSVYFDGFNLYHAIDDLKKPHLKWVNLFKLSHKLISKRSQEVVSIHYFSAFAKYYLGTPSAGKVLRHREYKKALEAKNVTCHMGVFAKRDWYYRGRNYRARWRRREEKQTDVSIAVTVIRDAYKDIFDRALIVSCDTDMIPAFEVMSEEFPEKAAVCVAPPARSHHRSLLMASTDHTVIKESQIVASLFGAQIIKNGVVIAKRPPEYKP